MKKITDTTREANENPERALLTLGIFGASGVIEASEAAGQQELVESDQLPVEIVNGKPEQLEAMGIMLGPLPCKSNDQLFRSAILPHGWKLVPTDHSMWSDMVDAKGRKRASIFYKAAFYDRGAQIVLRTRFGIEADCDAKDSAICFVTDCGVRIHRVELELDPTCPWVANEAARAACRDWLDANWPESGDPTKYWE
jgi:hypothetical protein